MFFGAMLGPSWEPRGSPNRAFWHQVASKSVEMMSGGGSQKKLEILIELLSKKGCFGEAKMLIFYWFLKEIGAFGLLRKSMKI